MNTPGQHSRHLPSVSIIVPAYNAAGTIERCVESLRRQSAPPLEIVVVNDGSHDATPAVLARLARRCPILHVLHRHNAGVDAARYAGMDAARGEYLMFVDADDLLFPDALEAMAQVARRDGSEIVVGDYVRHLDRFGFFHRKDGSIARDRTIEREEFLESWYPGFFGRDSHGLFYNYGKMCMKLYKRDFLLANRPAPSGLRYAEDQLFNLQVFPKAQRISLLAKDIYIYTFGGVTGNLTLSLFGDMIRLHATKLALAERPEWRASERRFFLNNVKSFLATLAVSGQLSARTMPAAIEQLEAAPIWRQALDAHPGMDDAFFAAMRHADAPAAWRELSRGTLAAAMAYRLRRLVLKLVR